MRFRSDVNAEVCLVEHALGVLDGRWTVLILRELFLGPVGRFNQLRRALGDLSPRTLSDRLRRLEEQDIVARTVTVERPVDVTYRLTARGRSLWPLLEAMMTWSLEDLRRTGSSGIGLRQHEEV